MITYEVLLAQKKIEAADWKLFVEAIANYVGYFKTFKLIIVYQENTIRFFVRCRCLLPITFNGLNVFYLKKFSNFEIPKCKTGLFFHETKINYCIDIIDYCFNKLGAKFKGLVFNFVKVTNKLIISKKYLYLKKHYSLKKYSLFWSNSYDLLTINFDKNKRFFYKRIGKYLDISKILPLLNRDKTLCTMKIDTFPYLQGDFFLRQSSYDFCKHSLVIGASGSGKSKFISSFIKNIYLLNKSSKNYKVIIIDPHANIENDIGGLGQIIDFKEPFSSIDLFLNKGHDVVSGVELLLELLKELIKDQYNSKLERMLRHALYILLINENFSFRSLKSLLLDLEYRNNMINLSKEKLPDSVLSFFLNDFNELKTKAYGEAIAPIISFVDEMEILPAFGESRNVSNLENVIRNNFLTIFSLDKIYLGNKITKAIAGLIMQQLLMLVQGQAFSEQIILVIDEIAVIESPILTRYLAEARKYNLALILAGQYFNQISDNLKMAIFSNVINYYIFRVSKMDASVLVENLNMKIPLDNSKDTKIKLLTELNNREFIVRVANNGILIPAFKAKTLDFKKIPRKKMKKPKELGVLISKQENKNTFEITSSIKVKEVLKKNSTGRKVVK